MKPQRAIYSFRQWRIYIILCARHNQNHKDAKELKTPFNLIFKLLKYPNYWKSYGCFNVGLFSRLAEDFRLLWCALKCILRGTNGNMGSECAIYILWYSTTLATNFKFRLYILAVHFFFWLIYNYYHLFDMQYL